MRPAAPENSAALLEGVVISPRQGVAYVMRSGGIDAVNIATGKLRWRSDKAAKPLAVVGDRLIAQGRGGKALDVISLDAKSGAARDSVSIPLPKGVTASVVDTPAGSFRVRTDSTASELVVSWEATGVGVGAQGYVATAEDGQAPDGGAQVMTGEAVLSLTSSSLAIKAEPSVSRAQSASMVRGSSMEELSSPAVRGIEGRQVLSADGRHVLVTEQIEGAGSSLYRHRWTMYERASGARLGSVQSLVSATPFVVVGTTLYHTVPAHSIRKDGKFVEHPTSLRAVNLKTGEKAWEMSVLETSFRGPFPP